MTSRIRTKLFADECAEIVCSEQKKRLGLYCTRALPREAGGHLASQQAAVTSQIPYSNLIPVLCPSNCHNHCHQSDDE
eukprot:scaffold272478_cov41-Prasinocladus_malaysianus.AAC.1